MSRAYRVMVRETLRTVIRGEDHVGTTLELLEVLPRAAMAELLREELLGRGFQAEGDQLVRRDGGVTVTIDPSGGTVTVRSEAAREVEIAGERTGLADTDWGARVRESTEARLREFLREDLEAEARRRAVDVEKDATDALESALLGLRAELDQVVNRVTAEALKRKAAQLGRIKEMTEDTEAGNLTIVLEV